MEDILMRVLDEEQIHSDVFWSILREIEKNAEEMNLVGCEIHRESLTQQVMYFYLVLRMHFVTKFYNNSIANLEKIKNLKKTAKTL